MDIYLQNTLSGKKEKFSPIKEGEVSMYNCGPTVYDYAHIGNLRSYVFADILRRTFEFSGYKVNQVINITDIGHLSSDSDDGEDKMTKALKREGKPLTLEAMRDVANFYFDEFKKDLEKLNIKPATHFPFASDNVQEDIDLVKKLGEMGFTYNISDGIYFDTSKFSEYGKLGNIVNSSDEHSRIGVNPEKKNSRDFAVWKFNKEIGYDAPFGKGFPGWHIECSAMSVKYLGPEFDIHTGGIDHIPVHHNNEIAQAVCAGYPYARVWMHNAFLTVDSDKMAKSTGNFITIKTLAEKNIDPIAYRYLLLTARYSSPIQFSFDALLASETALKRLREKISSTGEIGTVNDSYKEKFIQYINDDLDTPKALALVWEIIKDEELTDEDKKATVLELDMVLALNLGIKKEINIPQAVQNLINLRDEARKNKDFNKSDELRLEIEKLGYKVKDTPEGTVLDLT